VIVDGSLKLYLRGYIASITLNIEAPALVVMLIILGITIKQAPLPDLSRSALIVTR